MALPTRRHALALVPAALLLAGCGAADGADGRKAAAPAQAGPPSLGAPIETIAVESPKPGELHVVYEIEDSDALWGAMAADELIDGYRARLAARLGDKLSPRELLLRQRAIMQGIGTESALGDAENASLLLEGRAGRMGPATCLEALLFREQARRYPMIEHPSEMGAFVLRGKGRVRIYFDSMESVGGKIRREIHERVRKDADAGFEITAHLHNHPFLFDRVPGDRMWTTPETVDDICGALAPSTNDVHFYRSVHEEIPLRGAWVTNGLDTARFTADDFERLRAAA